MKALALLLLSIGAAGAVDVEQTHTAVIEALETTAVVGTPSVPSIYAANPSGCSAPVNLPLQLSSPFGPRWKYSKNAYDMHRGIDYYDEMGVPIYAVAAGKVFNRESTYNGGNTVILEHAVSGANDWAFHDRKISKYFSVYMHLDTIGASVVVGATIANGATIGTMGQTGDTIFTHLHFEIRLEGYCSAEYQAGRTDRVPSPSSSCFTGFDPHVHPFLFVGDPLNDLTASSQQPANNTLQKIVPLDGYVFAVRYTATRRGGGLNFDALETDVASFVINTRENIKTATRALMDDVTRITPNLALLPGRFVSASEAVFYDFQFKVQPAYVEVRDIYGRGLRWDAARPAPVTPAPPGPPSDVPSLSESAPSRTLRGAAVLVMMILAVAPSFVF